MKWTYLIINIAAIFVPFIYSFHPKILFYKQWKFFLPTLLIVSAIFIIWDVIFTANGIWWFNENYISGFYIFNLPIEEILFFFCIPYACAFTYYCFKKFLTLKFFNNKSRYISIIVITGLLISGIIHFDKAYTVTTFLSLAIVLTFVTFILKQNWLGNFYFTFMILLIPFFIINGILTGTGPDAPVVFYNENEIIGIRIMTIPVEDIFYGMELILLNILGMEILNKLSLKK